MRKTLYCGIDLHSNNAMYVITDEKDKLSSWPGYSDAGREKVESVGATPSSGGQIYSHL